jgi:hypothetical protein
MKKVTLLYLAAVVAAILLVGCGSGNQKQVQEQVHMMQSLPPTPLPEPWDSLPKPSIARMEDAKAAWTITPAPKELPKFTIYDYKWVCPSKMPDWYGEKFWSQATATSYIARCGKPNSDLTWVNVLDGAVHAMTRTPESWGNDPAVMTAYGVLQTQMGVLDTAPQFTYSFRRETLKTIYTTPALREAAYKWAMPSIRDAFRTLPSAGKAEYLRIGIHAREYLDTFNPEREQVYLDGLNQGKCRNSEWRAGFGLSDMAYNKMGTRCPAFFTSYDTSGKESPYRKVEAFCFRRYIDGVDVDTLKILIDRVLTDLTK